MPLGCFTKLCLRAGRLRKKFTTAVFRNGHHRTSTSVTSDSEVLSEDPTCGNEDELRTVRGLVHHLRREKKEIKKRGAPPQQKREEVEEKFLESSSATFLFSILNNRRKKKGRPPIQPPHTLTKNPLQQTAHTQTTV
ncbi:hypothetical protein BSKO_11436 [Bryopsis sp. KO-2023]|nr:hypothetical protein BSKO_11436 [Bryopsis sp. KO-2023]